MALEGEAELLRISQGEEGSTEGEVAPAERVAAEGEEGAWAGAFGDVDKAEEDTGVPFFWITSQGESDAMGPQNTLDLTER